MKTYEITDYGAIGDSQTLNTEAIQNALDTCARDGGGAVVVPPGGFVTGTIFLRSNVVMEIVAGGKLLGSTDISHYAPDAGEIMYDGETHMDRCLIYAENEHNLGIIGHGEIDGRGHSEFFPHPDDPGRNRPMLLRLKECNGVRIRDVTLRNPAAWTSAWLYCHDVVVDGITIHSRSNGNGDGLDFDGCENVRVSNSAFDNSDDSICLQTSRADRPCRYITVTNCVFSTRWAGMRIGLLSMGDFEQVTVSNCVFHDIEDAGLKIQMCEGGGMKNMTFSNLVMTNVPRPIFMTFNRQKAGVETPDNVPPTKELRNIVFDTILVDCDPEFTHAADNAIILSGVPGSLIKDITLNNIDFTSGGSGSYQNGARRELTEFDEDPQPDGLPRWPEYAKLEGRVPASGIFARHVDGLRISNSRFATKLSDQRPSIVLDDVSRADISTTSIGVTPESESAIRLQQCDSAFIHGCSTHGDGRLFVLSEGGSTVVLDGNRLTGIQAEEEKR